MRYIVRTRHMQRRPDHRTAAIDARPLLEQHPHQARIAAQYGQIQRTRSVRFGERRQLIDAGALLQQQMHQHHVAGQDGIMQHGAVVVARIGHRIDVGAVAEQQQYLFGAVTVASRSHQRCHARTVTRLGVGAERQQQADRFGVVGQIDFAAEEVAFVRIGAVLEQQLGNGLLKIQ